MRKNSEVSECAIARGTHEQPRISNTPETAGRKWGSWFQHCCINVHSCSVRAGWVGRGGRLPPIIASVATGGGLLLKGIAPVNTWGDARCELTPNPDNLFVTHLYRDHCERENVGFPAVCSFFVQDLWCSPSRSMALTVRKSSCGAQVMSDLSETKIRDTCMTSGIHENVRLDAYQCSGKPGLEQSRTPLRSPWMMLQEWM